MVFKKPLVSALMLTRNRFNLLKKSVKNFEDQDYEYKELVIVNNGNFFYKKRVANYLKTLNLNIKHIEIKHKTIGEMRNIGIENCNGGYIIIFDDDDYHAPNRISYQIDICLKSNVDGTLLRNFIATYKTKRYCSMFPKGLEGTLLFKNPKDTIKYNLMNQGEDTFFIKNLREHKYNIIVLYNPHEMYEYRFHGRNTVSAKHFSKIIDKKETINIKQMDF